MEYAIAVENIRKTYGDVTALDRLSVSAEQGKVFGLLGPNGAGKTTLVRILTTLLRPDSGSAAVMGIDVLKQPERVRHIIGLAGQYPAVDEMLTGRENLVMVGQLYHFSLAESRARAAELLKRFSLEDAANRAIRTYSGGMRRRLDLAASIVARPQVLFLDEPTTGLDPRTRKDLWTFIRELVHDGTTLLLTTQYLEEADELADMIAVIDNGAAIAEGTPAELKSKLGSDVLELRFEDASALDQATATLAHVSDDTPQIDRDTGWISVPVTNGTQSMVEAVRRLDERHIEIADVNLRRPSLDDVFLAITGQPTTITTSEEGNL